MEYNFCQIFLQETDDGLDRSNCSLEQAKSGWVYTDRYERGHGPPYPVPGEPEHRVPRRHRGRAHLQESRKGAKAATRRQTPPRI